MSNWTAEKIDKLKSGGQIHVRVIYTDGAEKLDEMVRTSSVYPGWPDDVINNRLDGLNALDLSGITLGAPQPRKEPPAKTQDELDFEAYSAAVSDYHSKQKLLDSGVSKAVTQQDVDAANALRKSLYKDSYGAFV